MHLEAARRRSLIVTQHVVVAEDLREILLERLGSIVDTRYSLRSDWATGYALAFFGFPLREVLDDARITSMRAAGTKIVVLNGHLADTNPLAGQVSILEQPFRSADVVDLLVRLGV